MSVRTLFISDLHLGTRACKVEYLTAMLQQAAPDRLFVVGDGIDVQSLQRTWYWPPAHAAVVQRLVGFARQGTEVTYIPGNHDDAFREYAGCSIGGIRVALHAEHTLADGRRILLMHGDEYDFVIRHHRLLGHLGAALYGHLLLANRWVGRLRRAAGLDYWSFAGAVKDRQPRVRDMVARFRHALCQHARATGFDGVIAGHVHVAEAGFHQGFFYANTGDWVESCTALVEDHGGHLSVRVHGDNELAATAAPTPHQTTRVSGQIRAAVAF
jgi:UDP-2,3-diacylglucosamine pyrophosphatase LpxH